MVDFHGKDNTNGKYVCPSDRQLALRAKLQTGWSSGKVTTELKPEEKEAIISVIKRNEALEIAERKRVGKLVERVEKIKERAAEYGPKYCRVCGDSFGILGPSKLICADCRKAVCSKCSIEIHYNQLTKRETWLCKICSETREMWKKSGAWFFKGLPTYELPQRSSLLPPASKEIPLKATKTRKLGMQVNESSSEEDEDYDDSDIIVSRHLRRDKNFFGLFLSNEDTKVSTNNEDVSINKKSPISPYSRQTSSSDSQKSQRSIDWETGSSIINRQSSFYNQRRNSLSSSWSIAESNVHDTGINHGFKEPVLGWLELSLTYDESTHTLECTVLRARDLPAMDSAGLADPFCKLNILSPENSLRHARWMKTKTSHKTTNPEFNETIQFIGVEPEYLVNSILYAVILDDDKYGNDFLGASKLSLLPILNCSPCRMSMPLGPEDQYSLEAGTIGPCQRGQILLSLCYNTQKRALVVLLKRCTNLIPMDNNGYSDPFIKLQLKSDPHRKKHKTSVKWRNLNPVYNEEFIFETRPNDLDKQSLIITVWDKDLGKSNDFLGCLVLGACSKGRRLKQWKDCVRLPDHYHEEWHSLSSENVSHH